MSRSAVDPAIIDALDLDPASASIVSHGSSGFCSTFKLSGTKKDGGLRVQYFVKTGSGPEAEDMFRGEHASLNAIHSTVPDFCPASHAHGPMSASSPGRFFLATDFLDLDPPAPLSPPPTSSGTSISFAAKLARLHTTPAPPPHRGEDGEGETPDGATPKFGFPVTTYCGNTPQDNTWRDDWASFYANNRLRAILRRVEAKNGRDAGLADAVERTAAVVVPRLLGNEAIRRRIVPVVVHGDLWAGNQGQGKFVLTPRQQGHDGPVEEVVFDPSPVYGHSEYELGIMRMCGGFGEAFWDEYAKLVPKTEPIEEWEDRVALYELYHHLNHYAIFGGGYRSGAVAIMKKLLSKYAP